MDFENEKVESTIGTAKVRFGAHPHPDLRINQVLSSRGLSTPEDVDRFIQRRGNGHPAVVALRMELGRRGTTYTRFQGSKRI